ncbi:hypothetical protein [Cellulomonas sp. Marseille-Q8402]
MPTTIRAVHASPPNQPVSNGPQLNHQSPELIPTTTSAMAPSRAMSNRPRMVSSRWMRPSDCSGSSAQAMP